MTAPARKPRIQRTCPGCGAPLGPEYEPELPGDGTRLLCPECSQEAEMMETGATE